VEEARTYVHAQEVAHLDETSWRQGDKRAWLGVAVTSWVTVFVVRLSRGGQAFWGRFFESDHDTHVFTLMHVPVTPAA
jgi:hypothetical protein